MVMSVPAPRRWTAEDVRALPDTPGTRYECVDGELLVTPAPRLTHQSIVTSLLSDLHVYLWPSRIAAVFAAPGDIVLDEYTLVQPDVFVLPLFNGRRPTSVSDVGLPLLFIEVLSPTTARYDRVVKRHRYQRQGIEYWIVDHAARAVERWMPDAEHAMIHTETISWHAPGAVAPLTLDLPLLFAEALGDA
jgi:Uma2 family endonuclease